MRLHRMLGVLAQVRARTLAAAAVTVFGLFAACTEGRLPTEPAGVRDTRVSLSLSATVVGTAGRLMKVRASYARAAAPGTLIPLDSAAITLTGSETDLPVRLDIAGCLADPSRELPIGVGIAQAGNVCILHVVLSLYDANGRLIDTVVLDPVSVTPGSQANAPPVQIGTSVGAVAVTPKSVTLNAIGFSQALNAVVVDQSGQPILNPIVAWSSLGAAVASVDPNTGAVTAKAVGATKIVATSRGKADTANVTVRQILKSLSLSGVPVSMLQNEVATVVLAGADSNNTAIPASSLTVQFTSSNPSVLSVNAQGQVKAIALGTAQIIAQSGSVSASLTIAVNLAPIAKIIVTPATPSVTQFVAQQFTAVAQDANGSPLAGRTFTWSSSDQTIATVDVNGLVATLKPGTITVTATSGGVSGTATLTVIAAPIGSITLVPSPVTINIGQAVALVATVKDALGNILTGRALTWTTSAANIATVDNLGVVSGLQAGTATISATSGGVTGTATVVVNGSFIGIVTQPAGSISGALLSVQPVVRVMDAQQNTITSFNGPVSVAIGSGTGTLTGTNTVNAVNGVATFTNLVVTGVGQFTLSFSSAVTPITQSSAFTLASVGGGTKLAVTQQPVGGITGSLLSTAPVVQIQNANGQQVTTANNVVTATLVGTGGTLSGTTSVTAVNGQAVFSNLIVTGPGTYQLVFTATGLTQATSSSFTIATLPASLLAVQVQPPALTATGITMSPAPVVDFRNAAGQLVSTSALVTATLNGGGSLSGTTQVNAVNGVATFSNLSINSPGTYTITFSATGVAPVTTTSIVAVTPFLGLNVGSTATATAPVGTNYSVPVVLDMSAGAGQNIASLSFDITFDPTKFSFVGSTNGTFGASGSYTVNTTNASSGTVRVAITDNAGFNSGAPTVFTLTLLPNAASTTPIQLANIVAGDANGTDISTKVSPRNQTVTIP